MPMAQIKVIEGVFSPQQKQQMIERVTDAITSVEAENLRDKTVVVIEEVRSGDWGIGGHSITAEHIREVMQQGAAAR